MPDASQIIAERDAEIAAIDGNPELTAHVGYRRGLARKDANVIRA
jgi:hypothetical protein